MSSTPRTRVRPRPRDSIENDEDDRVLDAMLLELGIPNTNVPTPAASVEVIELITPPPRAKKSKPNHEPLLVDLTISPSPSVPSPSTSNGCIQPASTSPVVASPASTLENGSSTSTFSAILAPNVHVRAQAGANQARPETKRSNQKTSKEKESVEDSTLGVSPAAETFARAVRTKSNPAGDKAALVVVQLETSLNTSRAGQSIREALKCQVYNGKPVQCTIASALTCTLPGIIRCERQQGRRSHCLCAIYYEARGFLKTMQQQSYNALVSAVQYLQTLVPTSTGTSQLGEKEEDASTFFVIIEGMDRALIELQKQHTNNKNARTESSLITFADLQEVAFQLFLDVGAHTKFTHDVDATAHYVALLTRELVVASSRACAREEWLETVRRSNAFRVTQSGATENVCANAWLRMLQVIPGVSEDKAQCLLDHFPTFASLMQAYRDPHLSRAQKQDLVADKLHDARIERALSKRIYTVLWEANPEALIG
ncbi:hypothetical protein PsorP6_015939 [Peronosclerospora sorghi]|uniref:Uncharacterized protein n=1 Tax=Peronosclerospora sorghi TaxID=230839 RepID=A0ACC0WPG9_9STRA|nr:hypothetical protein PsorP6_015939 [Peronosclerospora sorghi]